jgi:tRNA (uracil-5-)-methyltransferase TRM9
LAKRWQKGRLLNLGCGHGADFLPFKDSFELYGVDFSPVMLGLARRYASKFNFPVGLALANVVSLPYPDATFDQAISVATYHHLQSDVARRQAVSELRRVLKPGGEAFITVWNRCQPKFWLRSKEISEPWHTRGKTLHRYYYLFTYPELEKLFRQAGFKILKSFPESSYKFPVKFFSRNICLLVKKEAED